MFNYQLTDNLTIRIIKDEHFVFDRNTGIVHTFNDTGKLLWEQIATHKSFSDIVSEFIEAYDISEENAKIDIFDFFIELQKKQLLQFQD